MPGPKDSATQEESHKKIAIVTGASDGVGYHVALGLVKEGYQVIMACRDSKKAEGKKADIIRELSDQKLDSSKLSVEQVDMASRESVENFAGKMLKNHQHLSLLVHNAGTVNHEFKKTADGFEETMQVNYLSPFLLTQLLFPLLIADKQARILQVGSFAHYFPDQTSDLLRKIGTDYNGENYSVETSYSNSKLAAMAFCFELAKRIQAAKLPITCLCVTPGAAQTKMVSNVRNNCKMIANQLLTMAFGHSAKEGAKPYLHAAMNPSIKPGEYYGPRWLYGLFGAPALSATSAKARDHEFASNLWDQAEKLLNIKFEVKKLVPAVVEATEFEPQAEKGYQFR